MAELATYGYWGLFLACFLAATILPFSSEAMVTLALIGGWDWQIVFLVATLGNWLGSLTNYALGLLGRWDWIERYLRVKKEKVERWHDKVQKWGWAIGFICWLPFIGDLLALVLGVLRVNFVKASVSILIGKALRYGVIIYLTLVLK
jgi:membrane protein YqaA with SNARE-associated domain